MSSSGVCARDVGNTRSLALYAGYVVPCGVKRALSNARLALCSNHSSSIACSYVRPACASVRLANQMACRPPYTRTAYSVPLSAELCKQQRAWRAIEAKQQHDDLKHAESVSRGGQGGRAARERGCSATAASALKRRAPGTRRNGAVPALCQLRA